jgi:hypothetical protein
MRNHIKDVSNKSELLTKKIEINPFLDLIYLILK